jgi:hypothetical protein
MLPRASVVALSCVFAALVATACSENGVTPSSCPPLPLYDARETGPTEDPAIARQLDEAVDAGCATAIAPGSAGGSGGTSQPEAGAGGADN